MNEVCDDIESETEEDVYVYVDFGKEVENIAQFRSIHVIGVDDQNPVIQLDDKFYQGRHERPLGTYMFFEADPDPQCDDPVFDVFPEKNLKYMCKTRRLINMERIFLDPITGMTTQAEQDRLKLPQDDDIMIEEFTSFEHAVKRLADECEARMNTVENIEELIKMPDIPDATPPGHQDSPITPNNSNVENE